MNTKEKSRTLSAFNTYRSIIANAERLFDPFHEGRLWYHEANDKLKRLARHTPHLSVESLAHATAALSPLTSWERNMQGAEEFSRAMRADVSRDVLLDIATQHTVFNSNGVRAVECLLDNKRVSGTKTGPFAANLLGDLSRVTVDSWMWNIVDRFGLSSPTPTGNAQRAIKRALVMCASLYGIQPAEAQAIVWVTERDFS